MNGPLKAFQLGVPPFLVPDQRRQGEQEEVVHLAQEVQAREEEGVAHGDGVLQGGSDPPYAPHVLVLDAMIPAPLDYTISSINRLPCISCGAHPDNCEITTFVTDMECEICDASSYTVVWCEACRGAFCLSCVQAASVIAPNALDVMD